MDGTLGWSLFQNFGKLHETGLNLFVFNKKLFLQNISEKNSSLEVAHDQRKFEIIHMLL